MHRLYHYSYRKVTAKCAYSTVEITAIVQKKKIGFGTSLCMKAQIEREIVPPNMRRCTGKLKESPLNK